MEVYPLFGKDDLTGETAFLHIALWDLAEPDTPLGLHDVSFQSLKSAEWNYVPLRAKLIPDHQYAITYDTSGVADSGIGVVMYSAEEQSAFAPYLHCSHALLNGEDFGGCILQNILILTPVNGTVNLAVFLCGALLLAGIFAAGNRQWLKKCVPDRLQFPVDRGLWQVVTALILPCPSTRRGNISPSRSVPKLQK